MPFSHEFMREPNDKSSLGWDDWFFIGKDSNIGKNEPFKDSVKDSLNLSVYFFRVEYLSSDFINSSFKCFAYDL